MLMTQRKKPGLQGLQDGLAAEVMVAEQLTAAGWGVVQTPELDYANKVDVYATCPTGQEYPLQISLHPKSRRQEAALEARGVFPLPTSRLDETGAAGFVCSSLCDIGDCDSRSGPQAFNL